MAPKKATETKKGADPKKAANKKGDAKKAAKDVGNKTDEKKAEAPSSKQQKAAAKKDRQQSEASRLKEVDDMMNPPSDDDYSSEEQEVFQPPPRAERGKEPVPAEAPQRRAKTGTQEREFEDRALAEARAERAVRMEEREQARAAEKEKELKALLEKVEAVGEKKLSNKERRAYAKYLEEQAEAEAQAEKVHVRSRMGKDEARLAAELDAFSATCSGPPRADGGADLHLEQFSIQAGATRLFEDASLTLANGRRYGFLGPNGQGKTTLLKHLAARLLPVPSHWSIALVEQEADATDAPVVEEVLSSDTKRWKLLEEEQRLMETLEKGGEKGEMPVEELQRLCDRLEALGQDLEAAGAEAAEAKVRRILCGLGFTGDMADGPVSRLSGGWRMRVALAKALFLEPALLLLDEPTNHLDLDAVLWLDEYLCSYPKTLFVVSHDADFLDSVCTDVVHLDNRKCVQYKGGYSEFKKQHAMRVKLQEKEFEKQKRDLNKGKKVKEDDKLDKPKDYIVKFNFLPPQADDGGISVHDVSFSYSGKQPWLLDQLNFRVDNATRVAVVGANGAGKSTLLNLVAKVLEPSIGEVQHSRRVSMGRYSQHFDEISSWLHLSAADYLTHPELRRFGAGTENMELARKCLGQFGLPSHAHTRPMNELSGGQKARTCFASITCRKPEVLILDEPTNHLDIESVEALIDALRRYKGGLMLVSHDARLIQAAGCDLWVCRGAGEAIAKVERFQDYRREVLADLAKRVAAAEAEARRRAAVRQKRRAASLQKRKS